MISYRRKSSALSLRCCCNKARLRRVSFTALSSLRISCCSSIPYPLKVGEGVAHVVQRVLEFTRQARLGLVAGRQIRLSPSDSINTPRAFGDGAELVDLSLP